MVLTYEDNGDAVNHVDVIARKSTASSIDGYGAPDKFLNEVVRPLLGEQVFAGETRSEGGFGANKVAAASLLDVQEAKDSKGKTYYKYNILTRCVGWGGREGERALGAGESAGARERERETKKALDRNTKLTRHHPFLSLSSQDCRRQRGRPPPPGHRLRQQRRPVHGPRHRRRQGKGWGRSARAVERDEAGGKARVVSLSHHALTLSLLSHLSTHSAGSRVSTRTPWASTTASPSPEQRALCDRQRGRWHGGRGAGWSVLTGEEWGGGAGVFFFAAPHPTALACAPCPFLPRAICACLRVCVCVCVCVCVRVGV